MISCRKLMKLSWCYFKNGKKNNNKDSEEWKKKCLCVNKMWSTRRLPRKVGKKSIKLIVQGTREPFKTISFLTFLIHQLNRHNITKVGVCFIYTHEWGCK